jgi:hypothetical protein
MNASVKLAPEVVRERGKFLRFERVCLRRLI